MNTKAQAVSISIVIPVFNEAEYLKSCLDSIARQSIAPDEVIVVDNNSTDGSLQVAKACPFVRVITEKQQGVLYPRNTGFDAAKSDIIGRIDADTRLPENWVERVLGIFGHLDIAAVSGPVGWHDTPAQQLGLFFDKSVRQITWKLGSKDDAVFLVGSNMALTRESWRKVRGDICMRRDVHEDIDLAIHLFRAGYAVAFDDSLYAMTSSRRMNDSAQQLKKYIDVYRNTYKVHGIKTTGTWPAATITLATHFGVKLLKRGYDPETKRFSMKKFLENQDEPRVHPM